MNLNSRLVCRIPAEKQLLQNRHRVARRLFAEDYFDKSYERFWRNTIYTDEKCFTSSDHGQVWVYRLKGTR